MAAGGGLQIPNSKAGLSGAYWDDGKGAAGTELKGT